MNESLSTKNKAKWPVSRWVWFGLGMGVFGVTLVIGSVTIAQMVRQQQKMSEDARMQIMDEGMNLTFSSIPLQLPLSGSVLYLELWQAKDSLRLDVEVTLIDSLESAIAVDTLHFHSDTLLSDGVFLTDTLFYPETAETLTHRYQFKIIELRSTNAVFKKVPPPESEFPSRP